MIEKILDIENQIVNVNELKIMKLEELKLMREEVRLISNRTPEFDVIEGSMKNYWGKNENKVSGFDSLWAHINIAIEKKKKK